MEVLGGLELPGQYLPEGTLVLKVGEVAVDHLTEDLSPIPDHLEHMAFNRVLRDEVDALDHICLLTWSTQTCDALLEALRVPVQLHVDHNTCRLEVDALSARYGPRETGRLRNRF